MISKSFNAKSDIRLAMAIYSINILDNLARDGKIPGIRKNEALQLLEKISSCVMKMRESTLSKHMLLMSNLFRGFNNHLSTFISRLGVNWYRIAKAKDPYNAKLLRFAIFNLRSLGNRLKKCSDDDPISAVKVRYVRVLEQKKHPRNKKYNVLKVTDMEMTYEVVTQDNIEEKAVILFAHTFPENIDGVISEGIFLKDENGELIRGTAEDIGQRPINVPESAKKQIEERVIKVLKDEFLI